MTSCAASPSLALSAHPHASPTAAARQGRARTGRGCCGGRRTLRAARHARHWTHAGAEEHARAREVGCGPSVQGMAPSWSLLISSCRRSRAGLSSSRLPVHASITAGGGLGEGTRPRPTACTNTAGGRLGEGTRTLPKACTKRAPGPAPQDYSAAAACCRWSLSTSLRPRLEFPQLYHIQSQSRHSWHQPTNSHRGERRGRGGMSVGAALWQACVQRE